MNEQKRNNQALSAMSVAGIAFTTLAAVASIALFSCSRKGKDAGATDGVKPGIENEGYGAWSLKVSDEPALPGMNLARLRVVTQDGFGRETKGELRLAGAASGMEFRKDWTADTGPGRFMEGLAPGNYRLSYAHAPESPAFPFLDIVLEAGNSKKVDVRMMLWTCRGRVIDAESSQPIKGATILAVSENAEFPMVESPKPTDDSGAFALPGVLTRRCRLVFRAPGYGLVSILAKERGRGGRDETILMRRSEGIEVLLEGLSESDADSFMFKVQAGPELETGLLTFARTPAGNFVLDVPVMNQTVRVVSGSTMLGKFKIADMMFGREEYQPLKVKMGR